MIGRRPRSGWMTTYKGRLYRSTHIMPDGTIELIHDGVEPPSEEEFTRDPLADVWVRTVQAEECDRVERVTTGARLGLYGCQVMDIDADGIAELAGGEAPGWQMLEPGIYRTTAHVSQLHDYGESHDDLLFDYWRERMFGSGSPVRP